MSPMQMITRSNFLGAQSLVPILKLGNYCSLGGKMSCNRQPIVISSGLNGSLLRDKKAIVENFDGQFEQIN